MLLNECAVHCLGTLSISMMSVCFVWFKSSREVLVQLGSRFFDIRNCIKDLAEVY